MTHDPDSNSTMPPAAEETTILGEPASEKPGTIREVLLKYEERMALIGGCYDGHCLVSPPKGQHTNGGCRCWQDRMTAQRAMANGRWLADEIRKLVA